MKFGGGVLRDTTALQNFAEIVRGLEKPLVLVVSAFNNVTNELEQILKSYVSNNYDEVSEKIRLLAQKHYSIAGTSDFPDFNTYIDEIQRIINIPYHGDFDAVYDDIVSKGELMSAVVVNHFFKTQAIDNELIDIRDVIVTDSIFREANINWDETEQRTKQVFSEPKLYLTQGFIGRDSQGNSTTLGREGSDFTAAILAFCLNAASVHFWKEVRGIYNADPTKRNDFVLLPELSYREAVEQVYYGAKILHPKTIKPLQNKQIPIYVRPFGEPDFEGTRISEFPAGNQAHEPEVPVFIVKENQILISVSPKDFSFIAEKNLEKIFALLADFRVKVNLMENTAISFSVCVDNNKHKILPLTEALNSDFNVLHNSDLELVTIRHYTDSAIQSALSGKKILLRQTGRKTIRFVLAATD